MKQALLRRIKQLEQNKETAGNWEPTLTAIVEGTVIPPAPNRFRFGSSTHCYRMLARTRL